MSRAFFDNIPESSHTFMKKLIIVLIPLTILMLGFLFMHNRSSHGATSGTLFTNGGTTWNLGTFTINGTNVPMSNITVKAMQSIPPDTNVVGK
jgi:hypothetical protein